MKVAKCVTVLLTVWSCGTAFAQSETATPLWVWSGAALNGTPRFSADGSVFVTEKAAFRTSDNRQIARYRATKAAPLPDGSGVVTIDGWVLRRVSFSEPPNQVRRQEGFDDLAVSPNGQTVATYSRAANKFRTFALPSLNQIAEFPGLNQNPALTDRFILFRPDGSFVTPGPNVWTVSGDHLLSSNFGQANFALSPDGSVAYQSLLNTSKIQARNLQTNTPIWTREFAAAGPSRGLWVTYDGSQILSSPASFFGSNLAVIRAETGGFLGSAEFPSLSTALAVSPAANTIISAGLLGQGLMTSSYLPISQTIPDQQRLLDPNFFVTFDRTVSGKNGSAQYWSYDGDNHTVSFRSARTGDVVRTLPVSINGTTGASVAVSQDGRYVASTTSESPRKTEIFDRQTGKVVAAVESSGNLTFCSDLRLAIHSSSQIDLYQLDPARGILTLLSSRSTGFSAYAQISPDASLYVIDGSIYRMSDGSKIGFIKLDLFDQLWFHESGNLILFHVKQDAQGRSIERVSLVDPLTRNVLWTVRRPPTDNRTVAGIDVSPDGTQVAIGRWAGAASFHAQVELYRVGEPEPYRVIDRPFTDGSTGPVPRFSSDNKSLLVGLGDCAYALRL